MSAGEALNAGHVQGFVNAPEPKKPVITCTRLADFIFDKPHARLSVAVFRERFKVATNADTERAPTVTGRRESKFAATSSTASVVTTGIPSSSSTYTSCSADALAGTFLAQHPKLVQHGRCKQTGLADKEALFCSFRFRKVTARGIIATG